MFDRAGSEAREASPLPLYGLCRRPISVRRAGGALTPCILLPSPLYPQAAVAAYVTKRDAAAASGQPLPWQLDAADQRRVDIMVKQGY